MRKVKIEDWLVVMVSNHTRQMMFFVHGKSHLVSNAIAHQHNERMIALDGINVRDQVNNQ